MIQKVPSLGDDLIGIIERSEDELAHTVRGLKLKRTGSGHGQVS